MLDLRARSRGPAALLLAAACALTLAWLDDPPPPQPQPASELTWPWGFHRMLNLPAGDEVHLSGGVFLTEAFRDLETDELKRVIFINKIFNVRQVIVSEGMLKKTLDAESRESVVSISLFVNGELADVFVGLYNDPDFPWPDFPDGTGDCWELTVSPRDDLTWGQVAGPEDLNLSLGPHDDCEM